MKSVIQNTLECAGSLDKKSFPSYQHIKLNNWEIKGT